MKYAIVNLGCKVNAFEAEAVSEMLSNNGHTRVSFDEQPDATIVFTCAVTNTAAAKSRKKDSASGKTHQRRRNHCVSWMLCSGK